MKYVKFLYQVQLNLSIDKLIYKNKVLVLLEYVNKPEENFVMIEYIDREIRDRRFIYLIDFNSKTEVKFGRSNECEIKLNGDISVIRTHAFFRKINESFLTKLWLITAIIKKESKMYHF